MINGNGNFNNGNDLNGNGDIHNGNDVNGNGLNGSGDHSSGQMNVDGGKKVFLVTHTGVQNLKKDADQRLSRYFHEFKQRVLRHLNLGNLNEANEEDAEGLSNYKFSVDLVTGLITIKKLSDRSIIHVDLKTMEDEPNEMDMPSDIEMIREKFEMMKTLLEANQLIHSTSIRYIGNKDYDRTKLYYVGQQNRRKEFRYILNNCHQRVHTFFNKNEEINRHATHFSKILGDGFEDTDIDNIDTNAADIIRRIQSRRFQDYTEKKYLMRLIAFVRAKAEVLESKGESTKNQIAQRCLSDLLHYFEAYAEDKKLGVMTPDDNPYFLSNDEKNLAKLIVATAVFSKTEFGEDGKAKHTHKVDYIKFLHRNSLDSRTNLGDIGHLFDVVFRKQVEIDDEENALALAGNFFADLENDEQ